MKPLLVLLALIFVILIVLHYLLDTFLRAEFGATWTDCSAAFN